ncbi:hypothetical protein AB0K80_19765 [Streptomyces sp. NPDC052682]|uniref:hypothetical protein n=1 Tax=Streptomyces sp. NPDC052682 TaxID=3154954 RepID=UPI00341F8F59
MLALRLTRGAHPAVQLRRLLVAAASAGTGFLLLSALGYAIAHPGSPGASFLRLAWCAPPLAATVHLAVAVARTDPGTAPRPGLSAIGLGPARLMAVSATTTALSCTLGSMLALLVFLHLRGDLTGMPFDGAAAGFLAAGRPLPVPAALTLLTVVPVIASVTVAVVLRPREATPPAARGPARRLGRFGAYRLESAPETFEAYARFGHHLVTEPAGGRTAAAAPTAPHATAPHPPATANGSPPQPGSAAGPGTAAPLTAAADDVPTAPPGGLPWSIAVLAAGLAVETYAGRTAATPPGGHPGVLAGWALTALGLALAGPGLVHLCGRLLQAVRPGALRLLAGRVLMTEATRIGRPLGVVCAVAGATYALASLSAAGGPSFGPLTALGALLVCGCTLATLLTAAVEARQARAETTAALLRMGAPAATLRAAAALRAGALLVWFGPLTLVVARLAALPPAR